MSPETIDKSYTLLTLKEVAASLKISLRTVQRLVESDELPSVYIRGALWWTPCQGQFSPEFKLDRLLQLQRDGAAPG